MAKRKRRPGGGSKLRPIKDYRDHEYVPYIMQAETGILQAWSVDRNMRDGDVRQVLRGLIAQLQKSETLPEILVSDTSEWHEINAAGTKNLTEQLILRNLRQAFEQYGPLEAEDIVGILKVINNSVGAWNIGMQGQGYLKYLEGFLGQMGIRTQVLSEDEVRRLGLLEEGQES